MPESLNDIVLDVMGSKETQPDTGTVLSDGLTAEVPSNLKYAMDKDPDRQAAVYQIADEMGISPKTAEENFEEVRKRQRLAQLDTTKNPALAKFLANQEDAEVSHDDLDTLSAIEDTVNRHFRAASSGIASFPEMAIGGTASMLEMGNRKIKQYLPEDVAEFLTTPMPLWQPDVGESVQDVSDVLRGAQKGIEEYRESVAPKAWMQDSTSMQIAAGLGQAASQIATAPLGAPTMLTSLFTSSVEQQAERQRETGTYGESDSALLASGAVGMVLQKLGLDTMMGKLSSNVQNAVMRKISDVAMAAAVEGGTEVLEDIAHNTIERLTTNPDADIMEGAEENFTVGAAVGGIIRAALPGSAYKGDLDRKKKIGDSAVGAIEKTMGEQQTLDTLIPLLEQSTTSKRSAKAFKRFVETLPEGTEFRINPAAFDGIKAPLPDYMRSQIDGLGSDVIVKMDQLAKDFVENPELLNAARKHMRLSETAMTQAEVESGSAETIRNLMEEAKANAALKNEADAIFNDIVKQLVATGRMSKESARMNAVLIPAYITVKAKETGLGVAEIYERMNLKIIKMAPRETPKPDFGDEKVETEYTLEETGQKAKVRELKQVVYDRTVKRLEIVNKLRDCLNG